MEKGSERGWVESFHRGSTFPVGSRSDSNYISSRSPSFSVSLLSSARRETAIAATNYTSRGPYLKSFSPVAVLPGETNGAIRPGNTRSIDDRHSFVTMKARGTRALHQEESHGIFINFFACSWPRRFPATPDEIYENGNRDGGEEESTRLPFPVFRFIRILISRFCWTALPNMIRFIGNVFK